MNSCFTRRIVMRKGSFFVCLPKRLVDALGWKKGDDVLIYTMGDGVLHVHHKPMSSSFNSNSRSEETRLKGRCVSI